MAVVEDAMLGFCVEEAYPFGPLHAYEVPPEDDRLIAVPSQNGPLLEAVGTGNGFTVTEIVPVPVHPAASVTVAEYVPLAAAVTVAMVGFCNADVNPFGPDQLHVTPFAQIKFN